MIPALLVEWRKFRRSLVTVTATLLMVVLLPALGLGFYTVALEGGVGPLAQKAQAFLVAEGWEGYLGAVDQIAAAAMLVGAGVVVAWMFGREHADRTFSALFALPVTRTAVAWAKFMVLLGWAVALSALVALGSTALGLLADVGNFDPALQLPQIARSFAVALSATVLSLTIGLVASIGRGYLPAFGALILILMAAQVSVLLGTGGWFPFAVPGLLAIAGSEGAPTLSTAQVALVPVTTAACMWATVRWWGRAEVV